MSVSALLAVAGGGLTGALARYLVYVGVGLLGGSSPYATLIVNVVGSFAMGVLVETMALAWSASSAMRLFLATGMLGAFTTFSTFSLDFAVLFERRAYLPCAVYSALSFGLSLAALFAGLHLMRRVLGPSM